MWRTNVLNAKVVHEEAEDDGAPFVTPEARSDGTLIVVVLLEVFLGVCDWLGLLIKGVCRRYCKFQSRSSC